MAGHHRLAREQDLRGLLSSQGLRITEQRMVVLRELATLSIPVSHPELTERLSGSSLDRATIYRTLISLSDAGLLIRTRLGDSVLRYELPRGGQVKHGTHPHFVCTDCGDVTCLPDGAVTLRGDVTYNLVADVQLRGVCVGCSRL